MNFKKVSKNKQVKNVIAIHLSFKLVTYLKSPLGNCIVQLCIASIHS